MKNKKIYIGLILMLLIISLTSCNLSNILNDIINANKATSSETISSNTSISKTNIATTTSTTVLPSITNSTTNSITSSTDSSSNIGIVGNYNQKLISFKDLTLLKSYIGNNTNFASTLKVNTLFNIYNYDGSSRSSLYPSYLVLYSNAYLKIETKNNVKIHGIEVNYTSNSFNTVYDDLALYLNDNMLTQNGFTTYEFDEGVSGIELKVDSKTSSQVRMDSIIIHYSIDTTILFNEVDFDNSLFKDGKEDTLACGYLLPSLPTNNKNPKILVIPVGLDSSKASKRESMLDDIKIAFNGDSISTGWESVKSYFYKSSNGLCDLDITVLDEWFISSKYDNVSLKNDYIRYNNYEIDDDPVEALLQEAITYYDSKYDYSLFDSDSDKAIDSVWLIYDCDIETSDDSPYWAYTTSSTLPFDSSSINGLNSKYVHDNVFACYYAFASVGFMEPGAYSNYNTDKILVDSHTYIHETGHLFGLDDYYDYNEDVGCNRGMYGAAMMDYNIGDMDPYSKLLLNWINPIVVTGEGLSSIDLKSFENNNQVILIADHEITSIYDNYYLIEYYTNSGLNSNDTPIRGEGIRILKVNSEIYKNNRGEADYYLSDYYGSVFKYNNTDTLTPQIEMIYNGSLSSIGEPTVLTDKNLFIKNQSYEGLFFTINVIDIIEEYASLEIVIS